MWVRTKYALVANLPRLIELLAMPVETLTEGTARCLRKAALRD